ncbi:hypothetical protein RO3G_14675 [Rhizopus delemar RA 99-880]|uniref:THIF-type NAD/FAD binding fold domain-containing protein n=1 Tax=Rhizopus delemar (strain RA 99-880 / ATCC MYA-4621 / FGSC 9543 / NRRL 43880) TaxID=246409 RepID=I1CND4_RHIO9|nr:hypothetical protein RO3G_14675 [Rhizopus delemar RA 99-880]|eukprot:EIE89964.1 hypothetical protein RO3G_14675 [Rhizopus delemar RA 99-880]
MFEQTTNSLSSFLNRHQQGARITLTAVSASALTAFAILGYQRFTRQLYSREQSQRRPSIIPAINEVYEEKEPMDESLVSEFLARNTAFLGEEGISKVRKSFVVVVGSGAVGSYATLMLVRSGVQHIRIIDTGVVRLETLNCHALAKAMDIGKTKVDTMKKHLAHIAPNATVETACEKLDEHNIEKLLSDISHSAQDPLARMYRRQLRKFKIDRDLPVVYSIEKSLNFGRVPDFDTRSLPVLGPIASMFGMSLTTYVILQLAEFNAYELPQNKGRDGVYSRIQKELAGKEEFTFGNK